MVWRYGEDEIRIGRVDKGTDGGGIRCSFGQTDGHGHLNGLDRQNQTASLYIWHLYWPSGPAKAAMIVIVKGFTDNSRALRR